MPKTELQMQSYEAMNMSKTIRDLGEKTGSTLKFGSGSGNTVPRFDAVAKRDQKIQLQACEHGKNIISSQT